MMANIDDSNKLICALSFKKDKLKTLVKESNEKIICIESTQFF